MKIKNKIDSLRVCGILHTNKQLVNKLTTFTI